MTTASVQNVRHKLLDKPYLSIQEAADLLSVEVKLVRKLIHSGELPHIRLGGKTYRIPLAALSLLTTEGRR